MQEEKARVIQTLLFVAGINTLIQSFLGTRLPAVIGGSYTFVAPTISIILAGRYNGIADPHEVALLTPPRTHAKFAPLLFDSLLY
jgi:xanthine/uracil permease